MNRGKKGISGIIGGAILFAILFGTGATYFTSIQSNSHLVQTTALDRIGSIRELRDETFKVDGELGANNFMIANITNEGGFTLRVAEMFIIAPNGSMMQHLSSSPLPVSINQGHSYPLNSTVKYDNGTWYFRVITERGGLETGQYPPPPVILSESSLQQIENISISITTKAIGKLLIDFETFQFCRPSTQDCTESSTDWGPGWKVDRSFNYLFRVKIQNTSNRTLFFEENSAILMLQAQDGGGGNLPSDIYIKDAPTAGDDDGSPYTNFGFILPADQQYYWLYIGAEDVGGDPLQDLPSVGIYTVGLILFGYWDENDNNTYEAGTDTDPYSQNIPFQGMLII